MKPTARDRVRRSRLNEVLGLKLKPIEEQIINIKLSRPEESAKSIMKPVDLEQSTMSNRPGTRLQSSKPLIDSTKSISFYQAMNSAKLKSSSSTINKKMKRSMQNHPLDSSVEFVRHLES